MCGRDMKRAMKHLRQTNIDEIEVKKNEEKTAALAKKRQVQGVWVWVAGFLFRVAGFLFRVRRYNLFVHTIPGS